MLDELSGLHHEAVEVDAKLHPVIAGRKRANIQSIQEETATNIYMPGRGEGNAIWITGEYFGVQRAREMIFQAAHAKVRVFVL